MTDKTRIDDYIRAFARGLSPLSESDRNDIVSEIRAHLELRAGEDRLDEAFKALGAPGDCARGFLEEMKIQSAFADGGPAKTFGALFSLASRRALAALGLFVSGVFFLFSAGFAITAIVEIVAPDAAGLWIDPEKNIFALGVVDAEDGAKEILGRWLIPVAAALSVMSLLAGQWLARLFIRLMMKGARSDL